MTFKKDEKSFFEREREEFEKLEKKGTKKALKLYDFGASKLREEIKRRPAQYFFLFISTFLGSVITSSIALFGFSTNIIAQFAAPKLKATAEIPKVEKVIETNKYDHLLLASLLKKQEKNIILIDIRSRQEFSQGHIVTAVNIPVYETGIVTKEGNLDRALLSEAFKKVGNNFLMVIYGQNAYTTIPGEIAHALKSEGKNAKPLAVGWEEWFHLQGR